MRTLMRVAMALALLLTGVAVAPPAGADPRIVGGVVVDAPNAYPWVVALADPVGRQFCGGAIVSQYQVVTAAHCVNGLTGRDVLVVAGRLDVTRPGGTVHPVSQVYVHSAYRSATSGADIAYLLTSTPMPYEPIALAKPSETGLYRAGITGTAFGWGRTSESGSSSPVLRKVSVPLQTNEVCAAAYPGYYQSSSMFCAGLPNGGKDACQGDSGGPFVIAGRLAGLVSWGVGCARPEYPGVYTRVGVYT
ncbi:MULTISPECIES: serine protease [Actinosynnema]|uniref:serine protease n=1 Tax=Actinosynnema TaxID=40566 RepID=UPI0020A5B03D|nr:serine protease [Actinosynnema pretiosum]